MSTKNKLTPLKKPQKGSTKEIEARITKALQAFDPEELHTCLSLALQYVPNMVQLLKDTLKKSFSKWGWSEVCSLKRFSINPKKALPQFVPKRCFVPVGILKEIEKRFTKTELIHGPPNTGKEVRRNQYILSMLDELLYEFGGLITIEDEGSLDSFIASGNVEFVLYLHGEAIISVVEAKKDDIEQGKAQLLMELDAALQMNQSRLIPLTTVRGVVSTGQIWTFFQLVQGDNNKLTFSESDIVQLKVGDFKAVAEIMYWLLLQALSDVEEAFIRSWRIQIEELKIEEASLDRDSEADQALQLEMQEAQDQLNRATARYNFSQMILGKAEAANDNEAALAVLTDLKKSLSDPNLYKLE